MPTIVANKKDRYIFFTILIIVIKNNGTIKEAIINWDNFIKKIGFLEKEKKNDKKIG